MRHFTILLACLLVGVTVSSALAAGYVTTIGTGEDKITVAVVSGTPYEMGYSYGQLMATEVKACMGRFLADAQKGDPRATNENLDQAWAAVRPYVRMRFVEEMKGLAAGAGISYDDLRRAHCISLVGDYSCSGVAVWGPASANGHLYQIRNLDWSTDLGLQDHPVITVYFPKEGVPHANVAFAGMIGSHCGLNAEGIALTEKGGTPSADYPFDLRGVPFFVMFRDILQDARSLEDARRIVTESRRHKKYHFVIGDGDLPGALKVRAFTPGLDIWTDQDSTDEVAPKVMPNVVYVTMHNDIAYQHLQDNFGKYDPERMIDLSRKVGTEGALTYVVFDATAREMWVAYAHGPQPAKDRPYVHFRLADYQPPGAGQGQ